jgi:hypothetical protein
MALYSNVGGSNNTSFGYNTGQNTVSGTYNTFIGSGATSTGDYSKSTALGYNSQITENNQIIIGTTQENVNIMGNCYINKIFSAKQSLEKIENITFSQTLSVTFNSGMNYYIANVSSPITSLIINNVPMLPLTSYKFTFILSTTNSSNRIVAANITINSISVALSGPITLTTPSVCILQNITVINTSATLTPNLIAINKASSF